jgi:hypothetical protein
LYAILLLLVYPLISQQAEPESIEDTTHYDILLVTEITAKADEAHKILKVVNKNIVEKKSIKEIEKILPEVIDSLNTLHSDSVYRDLTTFYTRSLQTKRQEWMLYLRKLDEWKTLLAERSRVLETNKEKVQKIYDEWEKEKKKAEKAVIPLNIRLTVNRVESEIDSVNMYLDARIKSLLVMQNQISHQRVNMEEMIARINDIISQKRSRLFIVDQPPLWNLFGTESAKVVIHDEMGESWNDFSKTLSNFAKANRGQLYIHFILFVALLLLFLYFYRLDKQHSLFDKGDEVLKASAYFISRPISATFLITIFLSVMLYTEATVTIGELVIVLILIPMQRLMSGAVVEERKRSVHVLSVLYFIIFIINNIVRYPLVQRTLLLLISIAAILIFIQLIKETYPLHKQKMKPWPRLLFIALPLTVFVLAVSVIANVVGSFALSMLLTEGIVKSIIVGVILYTTARVLDGLVILSIRKRIAKNSHFVQAYGEKLERWSILFIHFIAFTIWLRSILKAFRLYQSFQEWIAGIMATQWEFGTFILSVNNIFKFLMILVFVFALSRLIRIILDVEVFSRIHLPRGIPGAISMIIRYTIVGVGIFLAISSLGVDLSTFGLLAGTLGVGLGFGLQNVIANFVSGLILTFERPIQVGDKIEVGEVLGNVKQIGVRSSTVRTFDGSEVIVPNADLNSNQVVNWTLTDRKQRMKLAV